MVYAQTLAYEEALNDAVFGGFLGYIIAFSIVLALLLLIGFYIYMSLVWATIAKKLKNKNSWAAWIPVINIGLILQLGGFHWAWAFLILIPIVGWATLLVLFVISNWRIFEKRKYPAWIGLLPVFSLLPLVGWAACIAYLIALGFAAWGKK